APSLHLFPTRRSSDLVASWSSEKVKVSAIASSACESGRKNTTSTLLPCGARALVTNKNIRQAARAALDATRKNKRRRFTGGSPRSEEHTSELQSRFDL